MTPIARKRIKLIIAVKRRRTGELKGRGKSTNNPLMLTQKKPWQMNVLNSNLANAKCESFVIVKKKKKTIIYCINILAGL